MTKQKKDLAIPITKNSSAYVRWARVPAQGSTVSQFSIDVVVDGITIMTVNSLSLRESVSRETGEPVIHIGSIHTEVGAKNKKVYSNTFFPGSNEDRDQEERRIDFVDHTIKAITQFLSNQAESEERRKIAMNKENQALSPLRKVGEELARARERENPVTVNHDD
jgi:hypothetical protein